MLGLSTKISSMNDGFKLFLVLYRAPSPFSDHRVLRAFFAYNHAMFVYKGTGSSN